MAQTTYINSFHKPHNTAYGPSHFTVDVDPIEYGGFLIYRRMSDCFDIVDNGLCIGMYAGLNGAKRSIDAGRFRSRLSEPRA